MPENDETYVTMHAEDIRPGNTIVDRAGTQQIVDIVMMSRIKTIGGRDYVVAMTFENRQTHVYFGDDEVVEVRYDIIQHVPAKRDVVDAFRQGIVPQGIDLKF